MKYIPLIPFTPCVRDGVKNERLDDSYFLYYVFINTEQLTFMDGEIILNVQDCQSKSSSSHHKSLKEKGTIPVIGLI